MKDKKTGAIEIEMHKTFKGRCGCLRDGFERVKAARFYLFGPKSDAAYRESRCSILSNNASFKMAKTPRSASNHGKQDSSRGPPPVQRFYKKVGVIHIY